jgi:hypothetical protein
MEAEKRKYAAWSWFARRGRKARRSSLGYVLHEAGARARAPARESEARQRFECEARAALREWLML